jgi:hypothetical protein
LDVFEDGTMTEFKSSLKHLIEMGELASEGLLLKDALPYLLELVTRRNQVKRLKHRWAMRCFYPDCPRPMSGATISPISLSHCLKHSSLAGHLNSLEAEYQRKQIAAQSKDVPVSMELWCPKCGLQHVDEGEFAIRPHKTHLCVDYGKRKGCGNLWRPYEYPTVGVLPG